MTQDIKLEQLERLSRLRDSGALTQAEFDAEKAAVLAGPDIERVEEADATSPKWLIGGALMALGLLSALAWSQFGNGLGGRNEPAGKSTTEATSKPSPSPTQKPTTTASEQADPLAIVSKKWLIGGWIPVGQDCASDGGVTYNSDGTFSVSGQVGTWKLEGATIVSIATEHMGDDGEWKVLAHPIRSTERFTTAKKDEYRTVDPEGERYHNRRCKRANVR